MTPCGNCTASTVANESVFLYVEVRDREVVYAQPGSRTPIRGPTFFDAVSLINTSPLYLNEEIVFAAEAPGPIIPVRNDEYGIRPDPAIIATWQDTATGYQVEARVPLSKLGTHVGVVVSNTNNTLAAPARSASFASPNPGPFVTVAPDLEKTAVNLTQAGMRLIVTDVSGWRIALSDHMEADSGTPAGVGSRWLRITYDALVESAAAARLAEPDPSGRERRDYVAQALDGEASAGWFRSPDSDRAVVAVAQPVIADGDVIGAFYLRDSDPRRTLSEAHIAFCSHAAQMAAAFIHEHELLGKLEERSKRDSLTGLMNYPEFLEEAQNHIGGGAGYGPVSMAVVLQL